MRVLLVHNRYREQGGEETHLDLLETGLVARGVEVSRFEVSSPASPSLARRARMAASMIYSTSARRAVRAHLRAFAPDVVHAHNVFPLLSPSVLHEAKHYGARVVLTAHNYRLFCPAGTLLRGGVAHEDCVQGSSFVCGIRGARGGGLEGMAYGAAVEIHRRLRVFERWTDAIIAPSAFLKVKLVAAGFRDSHIHVIPHGVPVPVFESRPPEFGFYAGRLTQEKGLRTLIRASELASVPVLVAGAGDLEGEVRQSPALTYLGRLESSEVASFRRRAAFTVVPSEWPEILPLTAIESLAVGTPVIASAVGGLPEIVGEPEGGILVREGSPASLAAAMAQVWNQRATADSMRKQAWGRAKRDFEIHNNVARVVRLYEQLARR